jgi:hypothetical protein
MWKSQTICGKLELAEWVVLKSSPLSLVRVLLGIVHSGRGDFFLLRFFVPSIVG